MALVVLLLDVRPWPLEWRSRLLLENNMRLGLRRNAALSEPNM